MKFPKLRHAGPVSYTHLDVYKRQVLTGVFHERIEYPDVSIPPRMERAAVEGGQAKPAIAEAQSAQREGVEAPANAKAEGVAPEGNSKASEGGERPAAEGEAVRKPAGDAARLDSPASGGDAQRAVPREDVYKRQI